MPPLQYWFTGSALAAFLGLLGALVGVSALGYGWYRAAVTESETASGKVASAAQKLKSDRVKDLLGKALASGGRLIQSLKDEDQAEKDAEAWGQQTHDLIAAAYGEGEANLFLDSSGYNFLGGSKIRNWIDGRMRRISELLTRADSLKIRIQFDPAEFD